MRTFSELAFQAAILKFGQGARFPALTGTPENMNTIFQATITAGMSYDEIKRASDALFLRTFTTHLIPSAGQCHQPGLGYRAAGSAQYTLADLPAHQQLILATWWNPLYTGAHAVMAVRMDGGRIFYKNPQYAGSNPIPGIAQGGLNTNPPRRYEDPSQSLESITTSDLGSWIIAYWVPNLALT